MTNRSGSFPLMNLAADYGVDYGDVLIVSYAFRCEINRLEQSFGRANQFLAAWSRIAAKVGPRQMDWLSTRIVGILHRRGR